MAGHADHAEHETGRVVVETILRHTPPDPGRGSLGRLLENVVQLPLVADELTLVVNDGLLGTLRVPCETIADAALPPPTASVLGLVPAHRRDEVPVSPFPVILVGSRRVLALSRFVV
jgi:hypothetical protein